LCGVAIKDRDQKERYKKQPMEKEDVLKANMKCKKNLEKCLSFHFEKSIFTLSLNIFKVQTMCS
jgi:hypothetical protein